MGILDDAIREHLELKRSHGASEDEIRFKEAEVFGPARADVVPEAAAAPEVESEVAPELEPAPTEIVSEAPAPVEPAQPAAPAPVEPVEQIEPAAAAPEDPYLVHPGDHPVPDPHQHDAPPVGSDPAWGEDTEFFSEPAASEPPEAPAPQQEHHAEERHPALHDTDEHFRGHEHPPEPVFQQEQAPVEEPPVEEPPVGEPPIDEPPVEQPPGEDEDVLEETPEFLQDAPEHDRLWFEQKPPRDFDFGE
jgi:hypothetical protein